MSKMSKPKTDERTPFKKWLVVVLALVLAAAIGGFAFFRFRNKSGNPANDGDNQPDVIATDQSNEQSVETNFPVFNGVKMPDWLICSEERANGQIVLTYVLTSGTEPLMTVTISQDGGKVSVDSDGTRTEYAPNGALTVTDPVGVEMSVLPTGVLRVTSPDSVRMIKNPDGLLTIAYPDGAVAAYPRAPAPQPTSGVEETPRIAYPFGMVSRLNEDGEAAFVSYRGIVQMMEPVENRGENCLVSYPDGITIRFYQSGRTETTYPNQTQINNNADRKNVTIRYGGVFADKVAVDSMTCALQFINNAENWETIEISKESRETVYPGGVIVRQGTDAATIIEYPDGAQSTSQNGSLLSFVYDAEDASECVQIFAKDFSSTAPVSAPPESQADPGDSTDTTPIDAETTSGEPSAEQPPVETGSSIWRPIITACIIIAVLTGVPLIIYLRIQKRKRNNANASASNPVASYSHNGANPVNNFSSMKNVERNDVQAGKGGEPSPTDSPGTPPKDEPDTSPLQQASPVYLGYDNGFLVEQNGGELVIFEGKLGDDSITVYPKMGASENAQEGFINARNLDNGPVKNCFSMQNSYSAKILRIRVNAPAVLKRVAGKGALSSYSLQDYGKITVIGPKEG